MIREINGVMKIVTNPKVMEKHTGKILSKTANTIVDF